MKIHPLTVCREKLQNNDFITTNYRKKAEMLEDIIAEEEELRNFAAEIYFEISNKILVRNSKRRKVLDCLKKLNLEYNYTSYVTDFDEINTMLEQFENRCQQLLGKKNDFSDAIENDYLNSRNILRNSIMDDTDIYNSISTVNPRIYEKMKWYLEGELRNNTETRKLELVLARIVSHAFTKTSPMGWLNKVGIIGTMNPIRYELKKNNISLNFVLLFQMYDRIILRDEYIEDVKFKLNKNFYIVDSEINIFGQRDNAQNHKLFKSRDCNVKVKNNPYFAPILNQADKNDWYFKDILELLELDKEQTGVFIRKLVEIGLFRIDSYFSDEGDVLQHFVDKLGEITKEKDDLASCVRGDFVEIQKLVKEINQEYSLDLEKRIIEIEKSAYHDNEFLLQKDGTDYKPVICTSLMRVLYPGIITFYSSLFSNISHVSDASAIFFNQLSVDRVNVSPRIKMLNIILERQHWIINTDLIKLNQNDNVSQFTQIYSFLKENNIPTKFFIQGRKKEYNSLRITSVSVEFEKPQYIDLENMVLLKVFVNTVATSKWINISEVIPTNIGSEEFLTEFIV